VQAVELDDGGRVKCDPDTSGGGPGNPTDVYNTPVIINDSSSSNEHVAIWTERNVTSPGSDQGYFFVRFEPPTTPGTPGPCTIHTEDDFTIGSGVLPSPTDPPDNNKDGSSASPAVLVYPGVGPSVFFPTLYGYVNRYYLAGDALPDESSSDHYSVQVTDSSSDGGTDSSGFIDPNLGVMLFGTRCNPDADCDVSTTAVPPREWGRLYLADVNATTSGGSPTVTTLDTLDLEAWTFGAPVGLTTDSGTEGDELLIALGTLASTSSSGTGYEFNGAYDCSLVLVSVDIPSTGTFTLNIRDSLDGTIIPGSFDCTEPEGGYVAAVDGFGGEPVPYESNRFLSQRFFGRLYSVEWNSASQSLSKVWSLQLTTTSSGNEFRHPNEMSPVYARYPDDTTKRVVLWGANQYALSDEEGEDGIYDTDAYTRSILMEVDLQAASLACTSECDLDVTSLPSYADMIADFVRIDTTGLTPAIWGPGAAGIYLDKDDPTDQSLVYVVATGARTNVASHTDTTLAESCDTANGDIPPRLNFFYKKSTETTWNHDYIDLTDADECYEETSSGTYETIQVPGGVAIHGSSAYVATNNGIFWRYDTANGAQASGSANTHVLAGPAAGWPRFRKNNFGAARQY
jgi:hypothetical protein